jgi:predicted PurR-regulated permease PerM
MEEPVAPHQQASDPPSPFDWERFIAAALRLLVWGLFFGILYLLRSFFLLIFLTFIFSYIQDQGVRRLHPILKGRKRSVVLVGTLFLCVLVSVGAYLIPNVVEQAKLFAQKHGTYVEALDKEVHRLGAKYPFLKSAIDDVESSQISGSSDAPDDTTTRRSVSLVLIQRTLGIVSADEPEDRLDQSIALIRNISDPLLAIGSAFFLALLFSFLILLDLPRLSQSIRGLADTKVGFIYVEVADSIRTFAAVLGKAFQAQLLIALVNAILTVGVVYILGLQKAVAFLSLIVFFCSFIPVAGVFISSAPICLMALQNSGLQGVVLGVALILIVHTIEAYLLNPRIFGDKLKINPVLVLIILTVAGKFAGIWGLLLSLPICTYIFGHAIRHGAADTPEPVVSPAPQRDGL